jgi:hypothetical protein
MHPPTEEQSAIIKDSLRYDPDKGILFWKDYKKRRGSAQAGSKGTDGYIRVMLNYKMYSAAPVCWFLYYGEWPVMIDHINQNPGDNKINNLRLTNHSRNGMNSGIRIDNGSGARGVSFEPRTGKWYARCQRRYIGTFNTFEEAKKAAHLAREQLNV